MSESLSITFTPMRRPPNELTSVQVAIVPAGGLHTNVDSIKRARRHVLKKDTDNQFSTTLKLKYGVYHLLFLVNNQHWSCSGSHSCTRLADNHSINFIEVPTHKPVTFSASDFEDMPLLGESGQGSQSSSCCSCCCIS
ncbi:hypothetical protein PTSG_13266 [Salpingoeca rosetta]|uniref:AMP-activated protein kinase glycogen-binding domain-containing protein n=1 Tax=Salpingoeca rosetta (strain ATCC 50818 / BSB-021) TaxID=946362 RepID=F2UND6_SALR5|nr:uncharacterized protein PTSG_13266 [Salpingoeca rosetta]EGD79141.1 hypothetical protein PTSG_13266 [Salpingoeca rosetta]|eukprot:XP_004989226.1 hypothetical protein PTSG_13266 [Salpingoeca rosetta]